MGGFQLATRQDLTGPFSPGQNMPANERPQVPISGLSAGFRQTLGSPGVPGAQLKFTEALAYATPSDAAAAAALYVRGFQDLGYTSRANADGLPEGTIAARGQSVPVAQTPASLAFVYVWSLSNLVMVLEVGGDRNLQEADALALARIITANVSKL